MSIKLIDFKDIQDSILEELKIQDSDTVSIQRIKRAINEVYINEVVPHARWKWLENHTKVRFNAAYSSGTVEVTPSSTTVTLTPAPSASLGSFAGQYFSVAGHTEVYIIDSHAAGSATVMLTSQFLGVFNESASFKVWTDKVALPTDCRETVTVWHNMYSRPMDAMGWQKFRELTINNPKLEGYPRVYYTGDFVGDLESSRYRELRVHPAIHNVPVTVSIDYVRDVVELTNDGDEPVIPVEDRIVLKYGALAWAWRALMRNPEEANTNYQLFKQKLERMAGKIEDSHDKPQLTVDSLYMKRRRAPKYKIGTQVFENGSGGSTNSQSSQFLQNPIIQGARFTADVNVDTGVTIDGVDISELAQDFADHLTDAIDAHDASSISFVPAGSIAATDVQTAIAEVATDAAADLSAHTADTSDAHDASAISFSPVGSIAATDAQAAIAEVATDAASALSTHEADTTAIHGITDTADLLTTSNTKSVTNKDIDGGTASNTNRITIPKAAKTTLDGLTRKQGTIVYDTTLNKPYYDDGSTLKVIGSGSGSGINFISDGDAEALNIFSQYNDSSTTRPVDGTGGTATNLSSAVSSTSPLAGTQSFILTKSGSASTQGMGWSVATATIDPAYRAKVLQIEFDYIVNSGTFVAGSSSAESDVIVYLYDVTNSQLIEPSSIKLLSNSTTISDKFVANFQTSATGSSYRLIFHCQSSSTANYSLKLDNIKISPCNYVYGTPITDWQSYTPTISNLGTGSSTSNVAKWRRVGDSAEYMITFQKDASGGSGASVVTWSLVSGQSVDANKLPFGSATAKADNIGSAWVVSGGNYSASNYVPLVNSATTFAISKPTASGQLTGADIPASTYIIFKATVPIQGWSSSTQQSDGYDGRQVVFESRTNAGSIATSAATYVTLTWSSVNIDDVGGWNGTDTYTVRTAGTYEIQVLANQNSAAAAFLDVAYRIDGGSEVLIGRTLGAASSAGVANGTATVRLNAGQTIQARAQTEGTQGIGTLRRLAIKKLQAPTTISATEFVGMSYSNTAGTTFTGTFSNVPFATKSYDSHNAWNGTDTYTCPVAGFYSVQAAINFTFGAYTAGHYAELNVTKNASTLVYANTWGANATVSNYLGLTASTVVQCNAGETIKLTCRNDASRALNTGAGYNTITITRIK